MRNTVILAAAFLAVACDTPDSRKAETAAAQGAIPSDTAPNTRGAGDGMTPPAVTTETYISQAANSDLYEIQAGRLAVKNGSSAQTREFGQMMIDDHTQSSSDMKAALEQADISQAIPARLDAEHQAMITRLESATGDGFDSEYMNQQMIAHRKALALHQGYAAGGDNPALKSFAQKVAPVIRKHHDRVNAMNVTATKAGAATSATTSGATGNNPTGE